MPRFAANLSMLFDEVPFLERFQAAAEAGFRGVEYLFPYGYEPGDLRERLDRHGLEQVLHNLPAGDWEAGERGIACLPGRTEEFRQGVEEALGYAKALGCSRLNCLAGVLPPETDASAARACLVENLRYAAERLAREDRVLLIEAINTRDIPGFFLTGTRQALDIAAEVGAPNLLLQYDVYHMQVMEGDLASTIRTHFNRIGHYQIADNPGRHEPGTGEINYPFLFETLDGLGYRGWVGCEYKPAGETVEGLGWASPYLAG